MRLIDTKTHLLLEPWKAVGKEYAILSHTWGDQEVIFQEWEQLYPSGAIKGQCPHVRHQGIDQKAGYFKVMQACEQAQRDGFRYLWCDTMCINKESSAELSEAINSMFKWYRDSAVCYVYLTDVAFPSEKTRSGFGPGHSQHNPGWFSFTTEGKRDDEARQMRSLLMASRWWTRGWTLQELLAPKNVAFFTADWALLGHKSSMAPWISGATRIHRKALEDHNTIKSFSIAQRMSWAADRQTTVVEDMAYCLLGIFDINMPMLYGQGETAFQKLQHEIIKTSGDQSVFAWTMQHDDIAFSTGVLAKSPRSFRHCGSIVCDPQYMHEPYSLTNIGFKMQLPMIKSDYMSRYFIGLGCSLEFHAESIQPGATARAVKRTQIWIIIRQGAHDDSYERIHFPMSHVYFQDSYPTNNVVASPDIYLLESAHHTSLGKTIEPVGAKQVDETGIRVAVGFGSMSTVSRAYKDAWQPKRFRIILLGSRRPWHVSHAVIVSGSYCTILSVAWDEHNKPQTHVHTTIDDMDSENLPSFLNYIKQAEKSSNCTDEIASIHKRIRLSHHQAFTGVMNYEMPMIVVEDEPFYDLHQMCYVVVDIIFKEKPKSRSDQR